MSADRIRTIITQDAEVDDQNSLRHFLLYTNEVELQGIVQTSSVFHWRGKKGALAPPQSEVGDPAFMPEASDYSQPYRWPGTAWMERTIEDYAAIYTYLLRQDARYPAPEILHGMIKTGNVGYPSEMDTATDGSELIRMAMMDDDPRKLYLQAWGGTNTIARALFDIQRIYEDLANWGELRRRLCDKIVITACGEQDRTYRSYIAEEWPEIPFVRCLQMGSYAYAWNRMPEGESKDTLRASFMRSNLLCGKGALLDGYAVWADGKHYEGEGEESQFGDNPALLRQWWGSERGLGVYQPYDFLSEGDSPTFFMLLDWGFRTTENFAYGGFSGRYRRDETQINSKGERLNYWIPQQDFYTDRDGNSVLTESMWRYVAEIQRDFAARADWCVTNHAEEAEHRPSLEVKDSCDKTARPGETVYLEAQAAWGQSQSGRVEENRAATAIAEPASAKLDGAAGERRTLQISFRIYEEVSDVCGAVITQSQQEAVPGGSTARAAVQIPETARRGEKLHVIVRVEQEGRHCLTKYRQVIIVVG